MTLTHTRLIDKEEIRQTIRETFFGDDELFEKYHFINGDVESALEDTFLKVLKMIEEHNSEFYKICHNKETIGYINIAPEVKVFHSFGIKKSKRNEDSKKYLLELVDSLFEDGICCSLYSKNKRAIEFLKRNGYEQEDVVTLFKIK